MSKKFKNNKYQSFNEHVWQPEIDEMKRRQEMAQLHGGPNKVKRHHKLGRLTARERIDSLLDDGSFHEYGALTGKVTYSEDGQMIDFSPANIVIGKGKVKGEKIVVSADDFTIRGGSSESTNPKKWQFAENLALNLQIPLVRLVEAAGGSVRLLEQNQATNIPGYPDWNIAEMLGKIPIVGVCLGPNGGMGAVRTLFSHFSIMVKNTSQLFAAGPKVVGPGVNEEVTKEELGGSEIHVYETGVVHNVAEDEQDAFNQVREFLSYLPSNVYQVPKRIESNDSVERSDEELASIIPRNKRRVYKMRDIIERIFDKDSLFEIQPYYGRSQITMFGRLNGYSVGILANDPYFIAGAMTAEAAEKITQFVDLCDTFNIPIVNLFDQPGVSIGSHSERKGTIKKALNANLAINQVRVPWCTVFIRRAFGVAGGCFGPVGRRGNARYAWPSAHWGSIPVEGGVDAAYRRRIEQSDNPQKELKELVDYYQKFESPFRTAEQFGIEEMIDPRKTRQIVCEWVEEAYMILPQLVGETKKTMRLY